MCWVPVTEAEMVEVVVSAEVAAPMLQAQAVNPS